MIALTWLRGLLAHRRSRLLVDGRRRRRRRRPAGLDRDLPLGHHVEDDPARDRARAHRLAGRGPAGRQRARRPGRRSSAIRASPARCPCASRPPPACAPPASGSTQTTGPGKVLGLPDGYAACLPRRAAHPVGAGDRRPARPADRGQPPCQAGRHDLHRPARHAPRPSCASTGSSTCRRPTRSSRRSARRPAPSRRRRPTTSCSCPRRRSSRSTAPSPAPGPSWCARRSTRRSGTHLPGSPSAAFTQVSGHARNLETRLAGGGLVGDNLGSALDQARQDALYAQLLFLFLGVPGAILAGMVTASIASAGAGRRRRDAALLRTRGASTRQLVRIALGETAAHRRRRGGDRPRRRAGHRRSRPSAPRASGPARSAAVLWAAGAARRRARRRRGLDRGARVARCARAHRRPGSAGRSAAATARRGGRATAWTSSPSGCRPSSSGRRRATATTSCSRPRASRRCRSTGTRCWLPCSPGSAPACSPTGSPTSSSSAAARRWHACCARWPASSRPRWRPRWAASGGCWPAPWRSSR